MAILIDMTWVDYEPEFANLTQNQEERTFQIEVNRTKIT